MGTQHGKQNQRYKTEKTTWKQYVTKNRLPFIISWYKTKGRIMPSVKLSIKIVPSLPRISFLLPLPRVISRPLQGKQAFCFPKIPQGGGEELCLALIPVKFTTRITLWAKLTLSCISLYNKRNFCVYASFFEAFRPLSDRVFWSSSLSCLPYRS